MFTVVFMIKAKGCFSIPSGKNRPLKCMRYMKLSHLGRYTETSMKLDDLAPNNHLARKLDVAIHFSFIYDIVKDLYSEIVFGK
jgi:hypothetical protein